MCLLLNRSPTPRRASFWLIGAVTLATCTQPEIPRTVQRGAVYSFVEKFPEAIVEHSPVGRTELKILREGASERLAILAPAPSRVRFPAVPILPGARLEVSFALEEQADCGDLDGVRFLVRVQDGDIEGEPIWESSITTDPVSYTHLRAHET